MKSSEGQALRACQGTSIEAIYRLPEALYSSWEWYGRLPTYKLHMPVKRFDRSMQRLHPGGVSRPQLATYRALLVVNSVLRPVVAAPCLADPRTSRSFLIRAVTELELDLYNKIPEARYRVDLESVLLLARFNLDTSSVKVKTS